MCINFEIKEFQRNIKIVKVLCKILLAVCYVLSVSCISGVKEMATLQTIDSYMTNLHSMLLENSSHDATLLQTVRDIVGRLEFNG